MSYKIKGKLDYVVFREETLMPVFKPSFSDFHVYICNGDIIQTYKKAKKILIRQDTFDFNSAVKNDTLKYTPNHLGIPYEWHNLGMNPEEFFSMLQNQQPCYLFITEIPCFIHFNNKTISVNDYINEKQKHSNINKLIENTDFQELYDRLLKNNHVAESTLDLK